MPVGGRRPTVGDDDCNAPRNGWVPPLLKTNATGRARGDPTGKSRAHEFERGLCSDQCRQLWARLPLDPGESTAESFGAPLSLLGPYSPHPTQSASNNCALCCSFSSSSLHRTHCTRALRTVSLLHTHARLHPRSLHSTLADTALTSAAAVDFAWPFLERFSLPDPSYPANSTPQLSLSRLERGLHHIPPPCVLAFLATTSSSIAPHREPPFDY